MSNRLLELENVLVGERKRKPAGRKRPDSPGLSRASALPRWKGLSRRRALPRAFTTTVSHAVPGDVAPLAQPSRNSCWATVFTMMSSWKRGASTTIETALEELGGRWLDLFRAGSGLAAEDKLDFIAAAGLVAEPPMNPSVERWEQLLREFGPIWVTTDEAPGRPWAIHARVITAIQGDGTPGGTRFTIIDPAGGRRYRETIAAFVPKYEEEVRQSGHTRIQILHWPKDARLATAKSIRAASPGAGRSHALNMSFDVRHDVELVPQQTGMSCWAAGAAMLVGWRDRISIDPSEIPRSIGYWSQYQQGLHPEDATMFRAWGLHAEPPQSYSIEGFRRLLESHGPLWVASAEPGPHIRVVTGISGDGTPDGTTVYINDPWERGMTQFRPGNRGSRYTETYRQFVEKQATLARRESSFSRAIYVAHLGESGRRRLLSSQKGNGFVQAMTPAHVGAAVAVSGLGYTVFKDILQNQGDIRWELQHMEGAKHPWDQRDRYDRGPWQTKTHTIWQSITNGLGDEISARFEIRFRHNGHSVGYVTLQNTGTNDAALWGLDVSANIMPDPNAYAIGNQSPVAAVEVTFNYRFHRSILGDKIYVKRYVLHGNGDVSAETRNTQ